MKHLLFSLLALGALIVSSCNQPSSVGADLVLQDQVDVDFIDTFSITSSVELFDSLVTYDPTLQSSINVHNIGVQTDPIFGKTTGSLYYQFIPESLGPEFITDEDNSYVLDSVILLLPYLAEGHNGDFTSPQTLRVYRITEELDHNVAHNTPEEFEVSGAVAEHTFIPNLTDSVTIWTGTETDTIPPMTKITLDDDLSSYLFDATEEDYQSDQNFLSFFSGLYLSPDENNTAMISYQLGSSFSRLLLYYTKNDTTQRVLEYFPTSLIAKVPQFRHDYTGTEVEQAINSPILGNHTAYVHGMNGVTTKVSMPSVANLNDIIVNKAELIFYSKDTATANSLTASQLILIEEIDGERALIEDVIIGNITANFTDFFGGNPEENDNSDWKMITMNITGQVQNMIKGNSAPELFLSVFPDANNIANRNLYRGSYNLSGEVSSSISIGGGAHPDYPMKLKLYITEF